MLNISGRLLRDAKAKVIERETPELSDRQIAAVLGGHQDTVGVAR